MPEVPASPKTQGCSVKDGHPKRTKQTIGVLLEEEKRGDSLAYSQSYTEVPKTLALEKVMVLFSL